MENSLKMFAEEKIFKEFVCRKDPNWHCGKNCVIIVLESISEQELSLNY